MKIDYILNTAALDPWLRGTRNRYRSVDYKERYDLVKEKVLPSVLSQGFDEVIVSGIFEEGEGYKYLHCSPKYRDRRDALWQREYGARHSNADIFVFGHDDHALRLDFLSTLKVLPYHSWDLLIPRREHGITGATLNNGKKDNYMGGHCLVMKRWLWSEVPWTVVNTEWWDRSMTRLWQEAGGNLVWSEDLVHVDVEATAEEK